MNARCPAYCPGQTPNLDNTGRCHLTADHTGTHRSRVMLEWVDDKNLVHDLINRLGPDVKDL